MKKLGHKDIIIKKLKRKIKDLESRMGGKADEKYEAKINRNSWHDCCIKELFPVVTDVIQQARNNKWSWARNWDCKYIDIRIDMRDGGAILCNRVGRISPEQLLYQYKSEDEVEDEM